MESLKFETNFENLKVDVLPSEDKMELEDLAVERDATAKEPESLLPEGFCQCQKPRSRKAKAGERILLALSRTTSSIRIRRCTSLFVSSSEI
jgi:hypothetical protein